MFSKCGTVKKKPQTPERSTWKDDFLIFLKPSWRKLLYFFILIFAVTFIKIIVTIFTYQLPAVFSYMNIEIFSIKGAVMLAIAGYVFACYIVERKQRLKGVAYAYLSILVIQLFITLIITLYFLSRIGMTSMFMNPDANSGMVLVLERGACYGTCPVYTFVVFGNGHAYLYNEAYTEKNGLYSGYLDPRSVKRMASKFLVNNYFGLNSVYAAPVTDMASVTTTFQYEGMMKSVYNYGGFGPRKLDLLENELDSLKDSIDWHPIAFSKEVCDKLYNREQILFGQDMNAVYDLPQCYRNLERVSCEDAVHLKVNRACYQRTNEQNVTLHFDYPQQDSLTILTALGEPFNKEMNVARPIDLDYQNETLMPIETHHVVRYQDVNITCKITLPPCDDLPQFKWDYSKMAVDLYVSSNRYAVLRNLGPYHVNNGLFSFWVARRNYTSDDEYTVYETQVDTACRAGSGNGVVGGVCYMEYNPLLYNIPRQHYENPLLPQESYSDPAFPVIKYRNYTIRHNQVGPFR